MKYYLISDIHGQYVRFKNLIKKWNYNNETLVIMGDVLDRGNGSKQCYELIQELDELHKGKIILLLGNHELMLKDFLNNPYLEWNYYLGQGGLETINSYFPDFSMEVDSLDKIKLEMTKIKKDEMSAYYYYLKNAFSFYKTDDLIFVHAAYKESKEFDLKYVTWERENFYNNMSTFQIKQRIFFGHTPTLVLSSKNKYYQDNKLWIKKNLVGIDGGAGSFNNDKYKNRVALLGVKIQEDGEILNVFEG